MFGVIRLDKPRKPQWCRTRKNAVYTNHNKDMQQEQMTAVLDVAVENSTIAGSTVAKPTVHCPSKTTVFHSTER